MYRMLVLAFSVGACMHAAAGCIDWSMPVLTDSDGDANDDGDVDGDDAGSDGDADSDSDADSDDEDADTDYDDGADSDIDDDADTDIDDADTDIDDADTDIDDDDADTDIDDDDADTDIDDDDDDADPDIDDDDAGLVECEPDWTVVTDRGGASYCFRLVSAVANCCTARDTCSALRGPTRPRTGWGPGVSEPPRGTLTAESFQAFVVGFDGDGTCFIERWRRDFAYHQSFEALCPTCRTGSTCDPNQMAEDWAAPCDCAFDVPCYYTP